MVLTDQPSASSVKELFEPQHYPDCVRQRRAAAVEARQQRLAEVAAVVVAERRQHPHLRQRLQQLPQLLPQPRLLQHREGAEDVARAEVGAVRRHPRRPTRWACRLKTPHDATGWTLPMQMGVNTVMVVEPVSSA